MFKPIILLACFFFLITFIKAQTSIKYNTEINNILSDDDIDFLDSLKKKSNSFDIVLGVGNKLFSVQNNAVNASQAQLNKLFYTSTFSYQHKSGFSFAVMPYFSSINGALKVYQTAISPAYNSIGKTFNVGFSYTRYFADYKSYNSNATFQNDFFTSLKYTKPILEPSVNVGYTTGNFKEINIDTIKFLNNRIVRDSTNNSIKNFSISFGVEHNFYLDNFLHSKAGFSFTPQLLLIAGTQKLSTIHTNKMMGGMQSNSKKFRSRTQTQSNALNVQSVALSFDVTYSIGKFSLSPNMYLDYYLHPTTEKRFTNMYSISAGISF